jgi:cobalt/nickel transport system permease protein
LQRVPVGAKLLLAVAVVVITAVMPISHYSWHLAVAAFLGLVVMVSRIHVGRLFLRLLCLLPFIAGVAWTSSINQAQGPGWQAVLLRSSLCLATMLVLNALMPFSALPGVLKRWGLPSLLVTTLTLLHRYLFVLGEETSRMNKARASRSLKRSRHAKWSLPASVIGVLFIRASERAERVYLAMCARGWK